LRKEKRIRERGREEERERKREREGEKEISDVSNHDNTSLQPKINLNLEQARCFFIDFTKNDVKFYHVR